jgi:hypothetical protein
VADIQVKMIRHQWLKPMILVTQEAGIRSKPALANSFRDTILKKNPSQKRTGGVAQAAGLEFKPLYRKKKDDQCHEFSQVSCS